MKSVYRYEKDGVKTELHIDNISRVRQKGDNISLIARNEKAVLHISEREMIRIGGKIELMPDDADELSEDADELTF